MTVTEIAREASRNTNSPVSEDIVRLALKQFKEDNLLENAAEFVNEFDGLSRREVVKRIGFASMVALPVISSLVAPSALMAQSASCIDPGPQTGCVPGNTTDLSPNGCPCTGNPECAGVCPVGPAGARFCVGGPQTGPFCAPGNTSDLSSCGCPCTGNPECGTANGAAGVCPVASPGQPRVCV